jgi:hypothetical protein
MLRSHVSSRRAASVRLVSYAVHFFSPLFSKILNIFFYKNQLKIINKSKRLFYIYTLLFFVLFPLFGFDFSLLGLC